MGHALAQQSRCHEALRNVAGTRDETRRSSSRANAQKQLSRASAKIAGRIEQGPVGSGAGERVFASIEGMIAHYARTAPRRKALLALGQPPLTYGALRARINEIVLGLRQLGIARRDREVAVLDARSGARQRDRGDRGGRRRGLRSRSIRDPTAEECRRYYPDLRLAALLTLAGTSAPGRDVADTVGIPVIDLHAAARQGARRIQPRLLETGPPPA